MSFDASNLNLRADLEARFFQLWENDGEPEEWERLMADLRDAGQLEQVASRLNIDLTKQTAQPEKNPLEGLSGSERVAKIRELKKSGKMNSLIAKAVKDDQAAAKEEFAKQVERCKESANRIAKVRELKKEGKI